MDAVQRLLLQALYNERDPEIGKALRRQIEFVDRCRNLADRDRMSQAFVRVTPVASPSPVELFGEEIPSMIFNRIEISEGREDPQSGEWVAGDILWSGLMSERSLTNLIMNNQRGDTGACITNEIFMGERIGPYPGTALSSRDPDAGLSDLDVMLTSAKNVADRIAKAKVPTSAKQIQDILRSLSDAEGLHTAKWLMESRQEALQAKVGAVQFEAGHMASNMYRLFLAVKDDTGLIEENPAEIAPDPGNPLLASFADISDADACGMFTSIVRIIDAQLAAAGREPLNTVHKVEQQLQTLYPAGEASGIERLLNWLGNENVRRTAAESNCWQAVAGMSRISGSMAGMHSDYARSRGDYFSIRIDKAHEERDGSRRYIRGLRTVIEISVHADAMLTLLRGRPDGGFLRCNLNRFANTNIPMTPFENLLEAEIRSGTGELTKGAGEVRARVDRIRKMAANGFQSKIERDAVAVECEHLVQEVARRREELGRLVTETGDRIEEMIMDEHRSNIQALTKRMMSEAAELGLDLQPMLQLSIDDGPA